MQYALELPADAVIRRHEYVLWIFGFIFFFDILYNIYKYINNDKSLVDTSQ